MRAISGYWRRCSEQRTCLGRSRVRRTPIPETGTFSTRIFGTGSARIGNPGKITLPSEGFDLRRMSRMVQFNCRGSLIPQIATTELILSRKISIQDFFGQDGEDEQDEMQFIRICLCIPSVFSGFFPWSNCILYFVFLCIRIFFACFAYFAVPIVFSCLRVAKWSQ